MWRNQKCIPLLGTKTPLTCSGCQTTHLKGVGTGPRKETCVNWDEPINMVPCLHQGNIFIERRLQVWRDGNIFPNSVQKPLSLVRAVKLSRLKGLGIRSRTETCANLGGPIAMVPCLHHSNIYITMKIRVWRDQKCIPLVGVKIPLNCAGRQTTPSQGSRYMAEYAKLRNLGWTYRHCIVFAPRQYLYQKEATGMDRPQMHSPIRCKNPSYLCGPSNYPVSRDLV